jgi:hypothetical protein
MPDGGIMIRTFPAALAAVVLLAAASAPGAFAQAAPSIEVYVGAARILPQGILSYPNTPVGEYRTPDTVTIRNTGTTELQFTGERPITVATSPTGSYSIDRLPLGPVAPGQSATFNLKYIPRAEGPNSAVVSIATNDPATPLFSFSLESYGMPHKIRQLMIFGG